MADFTACPKCGTELPADAPAGICPRCLVLAGLQVQEDSGNNPPDSAYAMTTPQPGNFIAPGLDLLAPHFPQLELGELLGQGGMGAVYKARQTKLDRTVALKIIRPESASDSAFAERFNREARTLARLSHPQIVGVHDFGEVTIPDPADPSASPVKLYYFLMEYVDGVNLRQLMEAGDLTPETTLSVISQICDALQFAHDEGIVHRDIKPENILLDRKGRVKIADFGLAKLASRSEQEFTLTGTHQVMGTPRYMAPEQMEGSRTVDHRADIYSLGVVFYEMLTGQVPAGHFSPPSQHTAIDLRLDDVVMKALAQKPDDRFQTASEIRSRVEAISGGDSGSFLSNPEPAPTRGFSTIFEREVGAAWNWVVHPEQSKRVSARPETAAFPRLLFVALAVLGGLTMFLPWAEIRIDQDTVVTFVERGARLTAAVNQPVPATAVWSSAAAGGTCFLMLIVLILIPHRRSPGLIASGVLTLFSLAAFIHTLAYQSELPSSGSVTLPLEVRGQDAARLEASAAAPSGDREVTDSEAIASKIYGFRQKVSLKFFPDRVTYREGFYASLGLSLSLLLFSIISVRNAIMNREPTKETLESWSSAPLVSLRFQVPANRDIGSKVKFHFSGLGYELADEQPGAWIFRRGRFTSAILNSDIRLFPTRLSVNSMETDDGNWLINCHWSVRLMGAWAGKKDIKTLEDEGRELESLLRGGSSVSAATAVASTSVESAEAVTASLAPDSESIAQPAAEAISRSESGEFLSKPEQPPARGFSTTFERAVGNVVGGVRRRGPGRIFSAPVVPGVMAMLLSLGGVVTMFVPWGVTRHSPGYDWYYAYDNPWGLLAVVVFFALGLTMLASISFGRRPGWRPWTMTVAGSVLLGLLALYYENVLKRAGVAADGSFFTAFGFSIALMVVGAWDLRCLLTATAGIHSAPSDSLRQANYLKSEGPVAAEEIRRTVRGPGIALMLYGLVLLFPVVLLMTNGLDIADGNDGTPWGVGVMMVVGSLCLLGLCGLLIRGGWHMVALENYNAALLAGFLGQPVGLWGLMALGRPEVKSAFTIGPYPGERLQNTVPKSFARTLLQFFTLIGILFAVSVLVYLARGGSEDSAIVDYPEIDAVAENESGVSDAAPADRIRQLLAAAATGDTGRVKTLLEAGTSVNSKNESAQTPLMQAAANGHVSLVTTLILLGADPNEQDRFGQTALMMAVNNHHEPIRKAIEKLEELSQIKDPAQRQAKLKSLPGLDKRLTAGLELDLAELKIDPLTQDSRGETVLMKAAKSKNLSYLRDADYDHRVTALQDSQGRTALMFAIETGDLVFLAQLMELDRTDFYFDELHNVAINDFQLHPLFDPRSLYKSNREGLTALQLAESLSQTELGTAIREELERFIERATQAIESGNESPEYLAQFLKFRGQAYLALGDKEKADADFKQLESPR